jgi:hypothetical protein
MCVYLPATLSAATFQGGRPRPANPRVSSLQGPGAPLQSGTIRADANDRCIEQRGARTLPRGLVRPLAA